MWRSRNDFSGQASAFIVTYPVNNAVDREGNKIDKAVAWEKAFIQLAKVGICLVSEDLLFLISLVVYVLFLVQFSLFKVCHAVSHFNLQKHIHNGIKVFLQSYGFLNVNLWHFTSIILCCAMKYISSTKKSGLAGLLENFSWKKDVDV